MVHVVRPLTLIGFAFHVSELTDAVGASQIPCAFISGSISEFHCAASVAETAQPLSIVGGAGGPVFMGSNGELALKLRLIVVEEEQDV